MFDRRLIQNFDWGILFLTLILSIIGLIVLYSAVTAGASSLQKTLYLKQIVWCCAGLVLMIMSVLFNYKLLDQWAYSIYAICILLLVAVLVFGKQIGGSQRWLFIGTVSFQPSEIVKVALIIILAKYYSKYATTKGQTIRQLIQPVILSLIPFILIVLQPDLGTAMLLAFIAASITLFIKIERRSLAYITGVCAILIPVVWFFLLKGYQKQRIMTFFDPERDPLGASYNIIQSKIAIGSGMLYGKGLLKGTQNALSFLPEQHTDFIFSVLSEEWGFIGSGFVLLLFVLLIIWSLNIAYGCRDHFGIILAVGISAMIFWQVAVNIGMVMGLVPVVGATLPFISKGGSSIITMMVSVGILMNISMRRFMFE